MKQSVLVLMFAVALFLLASCAGERQGLVCEEMEYRLNTMTYSPDQRAYMEEELRVCREQEAEKKAAGAAQRKSIYDRFAASDTTQPKLADSTKAGADGEVSVTKALNDSSGTKTVSIYDRYDSVADTSKVEPSDSSAAEPDTSAADVGYFQ
jgi:uncharacterized membrane protein